MLFNIKSRQHDTISIGRCYFCGNHVSGEHNNAGEIATGDANLTITINEKEFICWNCFVKNIQYVLNYKFEVTEEPMWQFMSNREFLNCKIVNTMQAYMPATKFESMFELAKFHEITVKEIRKIKKQNK